MLENHFYRINNNNINKTEFSKVLVYRFKQVVEDISKKNNMQIVNRTTKTLRNQFSFKMHSPSDNNSNVLYYVPCSSCPSGYIGESINLNKRLYQHNYDKINFNMNNSIVNHIANNDHNVNLKNTIVLHNINDTNRRNFFECLNS